MNFRAGRGMRRNRSTAWPAPIWPRRRPGRRGAGGVAARLGKAPHPARRAILQNLAHAHPHPRMRGHAAAQKARDRIGQSSGADRAPSRPIPCCARPSSSWSPPFARPWCSIIWRATISAKRASLLRVPQGTVKSRLSRARRQLQSFLKEDTAL